MARRFIDMFRRHGEVVRSIFTQAAADRSGDLIDQYTAGQLPAANGPSVARALNSTTLSIRPRDQHSTSTSAAPTTQSTDDGANRARGRRPFRSGSSIEGIGASHAPAEYRIMSVLVKLFREDREAELAPRTFGPLSAAELC